MVSANSASHAAIVYDEDSVTTKPKLFTLGKRIYPEKEERAGLAGSVLLEYVIDPLGIPDPCSFRVLESTNEAFESAAFWAAFESRFSPASIAGQPVSVRVKQRVSFNP